MVDIHRFEKVAKSGWCWNMHAVPLPDGGLLVHSPTWLGEGTFERLEALGTPRVLFAPNHYHHLSLGRFRERYPEAVTVARRDALPRLRKQGHDGVQPLDEVTTALGASLAWHEPAGVKNGEAWLVAGDTLLVCDAFFNVERPLRGAMGWALELLAVAPKLRISRTFEWLCIRDKHAYAAWTADFFARTELRRLLPSHGEPVTSENLAQTLTSLVRQHFA
jgi:hypothetical protein